ncbi:MAG: endolytic transglycosylase MltG [bacterium]|nr:endolytic transglycosylase MltG [bacterium]
MRVHPFVIVAVVFTVCLLPTTPPFSFPSGSVVSIPEGAGLYTLSEKLREDKVIRSPLFFRVAAIILGGERDMKAGQYLMSYPQNTFVIAWRVFHGDYDIETIKMTIPEGFTVEKISTLFDNRFKFFDRASFVTGAPEGYLFPDTYFVPIIATASSTIQMFENNFERKISNLLEEIKDSGHSLNDIIKMASILESEVKSEEDKRIVSGILWKRLKLSIALQVDSDPDTYKHTGFPPKPISNPGLESIKATLNPTTTPYLYFLTGDDGQTYYSRTFDEHVAKKFKYIKR